MCSTCVCVYTVQSVPVSLFMCVSMCMCGGAVCVCERLRESEWRQVSVSLIVISRNRRQHVSNTHTTCTAASVPLGLHHWVCAVSPSVCVFEAGTDGQASRKAGRHCSTTWCCVKCMCVCECESEQGCHSFGFSRNS